jgi:hypothetical protein
MGKYVYSNQKWSKGYAVSSKCAKDFWHGLPECALSFNFIFILWKYIGLNTWIVGEHLIMFCVLIMCV